MTGYPMQTSPVKPRRGRPPGRSPAYAETRRTLIRFGVEWLSEQGFAATGLDSLLRRANVPKGSFYHYFENKEAFGRELIGAYDAYFCGKLDRWLLDDRATPLDRLHRFVDDMKADMTQQAFARGCPVGNLGHEIGMLPSGYRERLSEILEGWQVRVAVCLRDAQHHAELSAQADCDALASFFWIGWEGAVLRARLIKSVGPLDNFIHGFIAGLPR
ncbi:TetR/AcrR family transcriptional regulator [Paraburkholderia sp.]|uniref:acrylate utilization transcriptional regulator AcuR n=1 Tax=Paraburkholderia sp. TaxID=1926495 RepID=UPI002398C014|nr:TetR/AcrR family transcriptional regulator [Paraburkholderia sp.]MDE1180172.1 TetR family transcriptional regulator C-terminal domain-containing protein [Paraburkholderia sp.]